MEAVKEEFSKRSTTMSKSATKIPSNERLSKIAQFWEKKPNRGEIINMRAVLR
jgi:hypothetical protein